MNLISLKEYAELHNVSPTNLRNKAIKGSINAFKIGRNWVIDKDEPYLDRRRKENKNKGNT